MAGRALADGAGAMGRLEIDGLTPALRSRISEVNHCRRHASRGVRACGVLPSLTGDAAWISSKRRVRPAARNRMECSMSMLRSQLRMNISGWRAGSQFQID